MRRLLLASAFAVLAGCDSGVTGVKTITGDWSLRTVNGSSLPYTISGSGANKTEVIDDVYTFFEGFTFSETTHRRVTTNGQVSTVTVTETGAFSVFGTSITITGNTTPVRRGLIEGNAMTIVDEGLTSVYKK
jgi:hypothetical protein